jgi:hypothetical protein
VLVLQGLGAGIAEGSVDATYRLISPLILNKIKYNAMTKAIIVGKS